MRNLFSLGVSRPHHPRRSVAHLVTKLRYETSKSVTKPVTKPVLSVTKLRCKSSKFVTKPLFFCPTLFKALRNCYETPQNPMFRNKRVEGVA